jgi:hypothetical protein
MQETVLPGANALVPFLYVLIPLLPFLNFGEQR